jgi:hypothetical protein
MRAACSWQKCVSDRVPVNEAVEIALDAKLWWKETAMDFEFVIELSDTGLTMTS